MRGGTTSDRNLVGDHPWLGGTTYGAVDSPAGPSMAAIDSPAGPVAYPEGDANQGT